jgi:hypothetical protein
MFKPKRNTADKSFYLTNFDFKSGRKAYRHLFVVSIFCYLVLLVSCHENLPFSKAIQVEDSDFKGTVKVEKIGKLGKY